MSESFCVAPHDQGKEKLRQAGRFMCPGHVKALPDRIHHVAQLHHALAINLTSSTGRSERVTSSHVETGLSLNVHVFDTRKAIETEYARWAREVARRTGHFLPATTLNVTTAFLTIHADWITQQSWVQRFWHELVYNPDAFVIRTADGKKLIKDTRSLRTRARSLLQPGARSKPADLDLDCLNDNCAGRLYGLIREEDESLPSKIWCDTCQQEWPPQSWLTLGRRIEKRKQAAKANHDR